MAGRFELTIIATGMLTLAFIMACVSTGTNGWVHFEQSGKDPTVISLWADQGLFEQCVRTRLRSRVEVSNCYSVSSTYNGHKQDSKFLSFIITYTRSSRDLLYKMLCQT